MIRAPDVDQFVGRLRFLEMIGKIAAEIGPATVGFLDRAVLVVAKLGRAEQGELDRFPVLDYLALGLLQHPVIDQITRPQFGFGNIRLARFVQFGLGREDIVPDAEQRQIRADHVHHLGHRRLAEDQQPVGFGRMLISVAKFGGQSLTDRFQIIARVQALGDRTNIVSQRFPIAQMGGASERIDLRSGVVDIIFADHLVAHGLEQIGQRIANHCTAAMAHVHRARRVGRDIFDIDGDVRMFVRTAILRAQLLDFQQLAEQHRRSNPQVDKAGTGDINRLHVVQRSQFFGNFLCQITGLHAGGFRQHHRRIGRQVAVRRIARRLKSDIRAVDPGGQRASLGQLIQDRINMVLKNMEQHGWFNSS